MDIATLGIAIDSSPLKGASGDLKGLTAAAGQAEAAAAKLTVTTTGTGKATERMARYAAAAEAEMGRLQRAMNGVDGATGRVAMQMAAADRAMRASVQNQRMMIYQLNDVAVSLASGMSVQMVAMQQGSQILQNGVGPALKSIGELATATVTKFWPIALAVGAASAAIAGMQQEINETAAVTVTFGDTALATWQVISGGLYQFIKPATDQIGSWFGDAWEWVKTTTKDAANAMVRGMQSAFEIMKNGAMSLPDTFIVAGQGAANGFINGIEFLVKISMEKLNSLLDGFNGMAEQLGFEPIKLFDPESVDFGDIEIGGTAALERLNAGSKELGETLAGIAQSDPMGALFGEIQQHAIQNATDRIAANADAIKDTGAASDKAAASTKKFKHELTEAEKQAQKMAETLSDTLASVVGNIFSKPFEGWNAMFDGIMGDLASLGQSNLTNGLQHLFGPGGMIAANDNGTDPIGAMPSWEAMGEFVRQGARDGTLDGTKSGLQGLLKGGNLAGLAGAGLGGLGIGYQTQSPITGALGGAMAGFTAGPSDDERKAA